MNRTALPGGDVLPLRKILNMTYAKSALLLAEMAKVVQILGCCMQALPLPISLLVA
jgi:hypothetical protein